MSAALWRAHLDRTLETARALRAGWPSPGLARRDPQALRALVLLLAGVTFFAASGERERRVAVALTGAA